MEKKLPEFKPLPELGNVANNYMSAFNVGMNIYEALAYLQGYVQITYNSVNDLIDDWNNFESYVTENINQIANEKTQEILQGWLDDGTLAEAIKQSAIWAEKVDVAGDVMSGDLQFQENTGVYGTLHSGTKVNMISHSYTGTDDYTQIGDDNAQAVIHSKNRPVWYDGSQNKDLLVVEDLTPQPNLLDNADFKSGIINQIGKMSYTGSGVIYTVDRWRRSYGTVTVGSNSVTFTNTESMAIGFEQVFDAEITGPITIYVNATVKTGTARLALYSSLEYGDLEEYKLTTGENIFHVPSGIVRILQIKLTQNSSIEIHQVKVEKGSRFTGMPQWIFTEELIKCLRFQKVYELNYISYAPVASFESQQTFLFEINFYKLPSVKVLNAGTKSNIKNDVFVFTGNRMVWDVTANDIGTVLITDKAVVLDANIY